MNNKNRYQEVHFGELTVNVAIVGGGGTCSALLDILRKKPFPYLTVNILNVCDLNPRAKGIRMAEEMGIPTSTDCRDIMEIKDLNGVIELTNDRDVLRELIRERPKGVWVLDHSIKSLIKNQAFLKIFSIQTRLL